MSAPGIPFARSGRLELRKLVDTRSGRWLLLTIGLLTVAALGLVVGTGSAEDVTFPMLVAVTGTVLVLLYPVLGILAVTAEASQRTALVTFTVEPRRERVVAAKLVAAWGWALVGLTVAVLLGAAAHLVAVAVRDVPADLGVDWPSLGGFALSLLLAVAQGVAFGLLLRVPAAAISAYFVVPIAWIFVAGFTPGIRRYAGWIDPTVSGEILVRGAMTSADWLHLAVSNGLWVVLPLLVGTLLLQRREIA